MTAFGRAMFDQLDHPDRDVTFQLSAQDSPSMVQNCRDFTTVRPNEQALIQGSLGGRRTPRVLDVACGIGRHSKYVRATAQDAVITVVEWDDHLRARAAADSGAATAYATFTDVPDDSRFDLVLLLGNGLGVFGDEGATRAGLSRVRDILAEGGHALIESCPPPRGQFHEGLLTLSYDNATDGPFPWGYATHTWLANCFQEIGMTPERPITSAITGPFFMVKATR